jgi:hypothetical protein
MTAEMKKLFSFEGGLYMLGLLLIPLFAHKASPLLGILLFTALVLINRFKLHTAYWSVVGLWFVKALLF